MTRINNFLNKLFIITNTSKAYFAYLVFLFVFLTILEVLSLSIIYPLAKSLTGNENSIEDIVIHVEKNVGPIEVAVYNIGAQIGNRDLKDTSYKAFEMGWKMATFGLFRLAQVLTPLMEDRQSGTILVTSATSAVRGNKGQISHASAMGGRRMICQSLNAEFAPKNIHIAHIIIDGAVDAPDTLGKMLGAEAFQKLRESKGMEHDGLLVPEKIAETYLHIALQHRSAWTHEIDLRAYSDQAWWNT